MPMFDFVCPRCGEQFEELVKKASEKVECPKCGCAACERQLARVAFSVDGNFTSSTGSSACSGCSTSSCSGCGSAH